MCSRMCSLTVRGEQSDVSTFFQEGGKESDVPGVIAELVSAFLRVDSRTCRMRTPGCHTIKKQQHGFAFRVYLAMQLAVRMHRRRGYKYTQPAPRFVCRPVRLPACWCVCGVAAAWRQLGSEHSLTSVTARGVLVRSRQPRSSADDAGRA